MLIPIALTETSRPYTGFREAALELKFLELKFLELRFRAESAVIQALPKTPPELPW
jgi:hypothetical protein